MSMYSYSIHFKWFELNYLFDNYRYTSWHMWCLLTILWSCHIARTWKGEFLYGGTRTLAYFLNGNRKTAYILVDFGKQEN